MFTFGRIGCTATATLAMATASLAQSTEIVSVSFAGSSGNNNSYSSAVTPDGRYVVFESWADNLVPGDTNGWQDIFIRDMLTNTTTLVSVSSTGNQANGGSRVPSITPDGRYIAFYSDANNLVPGESNIFNQVYVRDLQTGQTSRVSVSSDGALGNHHSYTFPQAISDDGRYVAFVSFAGNFFPGAIAGSPRVYVHDRQTAQTTLVSVGHDGLPPNGPSSNSSISADGRYVAFSGAGITLPPYQYVGMQIFVRDRQSGTTELISVSSTDVVGNSNSDYPRIAPDGSAVVFESFASNLVPGYGGGTFAQVYHRNRLTQTTSIVSVNTTGQQGTNWSTRPAVSGNGRFVVWQTASMNLAPGAIGWESIHVRDMVTGEVSLASVSSAGEPASHQSSQADLSRDGRYVVFSSLATNLVPGFSGFQLYRRDRGASCLPADLNCSGTVGVADLLILLANWGPCPNPGPGNCPPDLNGDGIVGVADLLILLANWG